MGKQGRLGLTRRALPGKLNARKMTTSKLKVSTGKETRRRENKHEPERMDEEKPAQTHAKSTTSMEVDSESPPETVARADGRFVFKHPERRRRARARSI